MLWEVIRGGMSVVFLVFGGVVMIMDLFLLSVVESLLRVVVNERLVLMVLRLKVVGVICLVCLFFGLLD